MWTYMGHFHYLKLNRGEIDRCLGWFERSCWDIIWDQRWSWRSHRWFSPGQPWASAGPWHFLFLVVTGAAMVSNGIINLRVALLGLFLQFFAIQLSAYGNHLGPTFLENFNSLMSAVFSMLLFPVIFYSVSILRKTFTFINSMKFFSKLMDFHLRYIILRIFFAKMQKNDLSEIRTEIAFKNFCRIISTLVRYKELCVRTFS